MPEFDLDNLKKSWQEQDVQPKYDSQEILKMLNRKSRNYVKYIWWISLLEFIIILGFSAYYFLVGEDEKNFSHILERLGVEKTEQVAENLELVYRVVKILSIAIISVFVYKFYKSYKKISIESNLKKFITQIIKFKKTVNLFVLTNIFFLVVVTGVFILLIANAISQQNVEVSGNTIAGFFVGVLVALLFSVALIWLYYRLVYGIIVGKLTKNLNQLKKIEEEEVE